MSLTTANLKTVLDKWEQDIAAGRGRVVVEARYVPYVRDPYWREPAPLPDWYRMEPLRKLMIITLATFAVIFAVATLLVQ